MLDMNGTIVSTMNNEVIEGVYVLILIENLAPVNYHFQINNGNNNSVNIKHTIH